MRVKHRVRTANALFEKAAKADPDALCKVGETPIAKQGAFDGLEPRR